jgi:serine/threonine-protein kinase
MGEVYRARDTKLKRDVALKVLPEIFASDPERMARFQREAEVLASLNHPNIAHLYGIEERALVMELVEGATLPCPLAVETALHYAKQIAEALEYAHERGVIHRDLKPANIKITPEGVVKVLDFGLAKAIDDPVPGSDPSNSPTLTMGATRVGMILGTAAYMSPEQAHGYPADRRADIWSFGAVFYEMLSGKRAFAGESVSDTLATVLKLDPDWNALPAATPAPIRMLLRRCLTKDRKQRLQASGEARIVIEETLSGSAASQEVEAQAAGARHWLWPALAAALAILVGVALWAPWRTEKAIDRPLVRLDVDLGADVSLPAAAALPDVIISPDGTRLVYVSGTPTKLFTQRLDQPQSRATELHGTEGADSPFFSQDGQWVGFFVSDGRLSKISVEGGAVVPLTQLEGFGGAAWDADGSIIVGKLEGSMIRIPPGGGAPADIAESELDPTKIHKLPQILPGGKAILFGVGSVDTDTDTFQILTLADHKRKMLVRAGFARYLPSGHLIYSNRGTLFAVPFDLDRLEMRGPAVPILDDVAYFALSGVADLDVSSAPSGHGTLVYRRGGALGQAGSSLRASTIQWMDSGGKKEPLLAKPGRYFDARLSPDGKRLALTTADDPVHGGDVWVYDPSRDNMTPLTSGSKYIGLTWSADGQFVIFGTEASGMFWTRADGAGQPQSLTPSKNAQIPSSVTPDGKWLAYGEGPAITLGFTDQIWTVPLEEQGGQLKAGKPEQFPTGQFAAANPAVSPDGKWLAYTALRPGGSTVNSPPEVYVRPFPPAPSGQERQWKISNNGGALPVWSRNGRDLFYVWMDGISAASYTVQGDSFAAQKPRLWHANANLMNAFRDVAPDGKQVLLVTPVDAPKPSSEPPKPEHTMVFLENFFDYLRQRVPAGR